VSFLTGPAEGAVSTTTGLAISTLITGKQCLATLVGLHRYDKLKPVTWLSIEDMEKRDLTVPVTL
jgi:hypothetical protein